MADSGGARNGIAHRKSPRPGLGGNRGPGGVAVKRGRELETFDEKTKRGRSH